VAGKGKVSNDLVAVSCAAVLAVYSAGYWRTRDAARRIDAQAQERRAVTPERAADSASPPSASDTVADVHPAEVTADLIVPPVTADVAAEPEATFVAPAKEIAAPLPSSPEPLPEASPSVPVPVVADAGATSATEAVAAAVPPEAPAVPIANWQDGTYTGWGASRHGDIKAQVIIRGGRIVESSIVSCETRWPCDVISEIIDQPVQRQSPEVDRVSRATVSADAYYLALVQALEHALPEPPSESALPP
jgi:uncharacterized protein with FMN-binding domain